MSASLTVRDATRADLPAIIAMLVDDDLGSTREDASEAGRTIYEDAFARIEDCETVFLKVAEQESEIVGTFLFIVIPGLALKGMLRVEIEQVRIASSHRGEGLGRQMIGWAIDEARRMGAGMVQLTMNKSRTESHRFYESLGFVASHEGFKLYP
ncbi:N-acetyltransferase family protein [Tepidamorphus sp. 3E244]|uniref:GNAT family N-acetyltransferase n=1 Tax=Tepidamorphus sp. 3E244 TaxID=3385498 RepID=UPI0038FC6C68